MSVVAIAALAAAGLVAHKSRSTSSTVERDERTGAPKRKLHTGGAAGGTPPPLPGGSGDTGDDWSTRVLTTAEQLAVTQCQEELGLTEARCKEIAAAFDSPSAFGHFVEKAIKDGAGAACAAYGGEGARPVCEKVAGWFIDEYVGLYCLLKPERTRTVFQHKGGMVRAAKSAADLKAGEFLLTREQVDDYWWDLIRENTGIRMQSTAALACRLEVWEMADSSRRFSVPAALAYSGLGYTVCTARDWSGKLTKTADLLALATKAGGQPAIDAAAGFLSNESFDALAKAGWFVKCGWHQDGC
jgi:hypothetical protein